MIGGGVPMFGQGSRSAANPGGGLPFAGIPWEMQEGVDRLLAEEPEHPEPVARFAYRKGKQEGARLTLSGLVFRHWRYAVAACALVAVVSVVNQAGPKLIDIGIDSGMLDKKFHVVVVVSILFLAAALITALAQRSLARVTGRLAANVMNDLRITVFTHLQRLGLDFYTDEKAGVIMTRMTSDIENLQQLLQDGLAQLSVQALTMLVISILLFTLNVELAAVAILLVIPALTVSSIWFKRASERAYDRVRDGIAGVLGDLSENLHGVRTVTAHNRQRHNVVSHRNVVGDYRRANDYTAQIGALYGPGTQLLGYLAQGIVLAVGGALVVHKSLSIGGLVAFFLYMNRFTTPIQLLVQQYNTFQQGHASIFKLRTLLEMGSNVEESPDAIVLPPIEGKVVFEKVGFVYAGNDGSHDLDAIFHERGDRRHRRGGREGPRPDDAAVESVNTPALIDVDLEIAAGETVALVGETGAGKSTIAKLVTRFYDPTSGRVLIDGYDIRNVTIDSLRRQLGVVPQEPFLFAGTVRENIAYARPDAPDEEVVEAVRAVGLDDLVSRLPEGLDTFVHERGQTLSSGERQLIALARAFLARPRVLVLDEATSSLDLASEAKIEAALDVLLEARTAILIAHRLTTAMKADRIAVVAEGRVVEMGSHDDLVAAGGRYADMYATWIRHAEGEAA
jgi:ATP-binding cassette, subfamily B, bacterial